MTVAKRVLVSGRVQGVFFRDSCRREAERLGVSGAARNLADGRVEVLASGAEAAVDRLIEWCRQGPPHASVDSVEVEQVSPESVPSGSFDTD
ncbi:MAG: acylphosphatase [Actinomycetota bacterium]|nr:acylphosphatase [Actinomycetota bacterium]